MVGFEVSVSELMDMSAEQLRSRGTDRLLLDGMDQSHGPDLNVVNERLMNFVDGVSSSPKPQPKSSWSTTPDPFDPVEIAIQRQINLREAQKAYYDLVQDGGRPSHNPDDPGYESLFEPVLPNTAIFYEPQTDIIKYWISTAHGKEDILQAQQRHWVEFRKHQDWRRWRYWKPEWFEKFIREVNDYRVKKGIDDGICLLQDRSKQTQLDDWKEFQHWEYRKVDQVVLKINDYSSKIQAKEKILEEAVEQGLDAQEMDRIRYDIDIYEGHREGTELRLQRQKIFLNWINEQLPIIASECQTTAIESDVTIGSSSALTTTPLRKRKRSEDQTSRSKNARRKVHFTEVPGADSAPLEIACDGKTASTRESQIKGAIHLKENIIDGTIGESSVPRYQGPLTQDTNISTSERFDPSASEPQDEEVPAQITSNLSDHIPNTAAGSITLPPEEGEAKTHLTTETRSSRRTSSKEPALRRSSLQRVRTSRVSKGSESRRPTQTEIPSDTVRVGARRSQRTHKQQSKTGTITTETIKPLPIRERQEKDLLADISVRESPRLLGRPKINYPG